TCSRARYSSSSMSPDSSSSCSRMRSSLMVESSVSSSSTARRTLSSVHIVPSHGPVNGASRMDDSSPMLVGLLQLELDVDEVVRRPRPGILEREEMLVATTQLLHGVVERLLTGPVDQKRRVHDHAVSDDLVAPARNGDALEFLVHSCDVPAGGFLQRTLDQSAELHAREICG